MLAVRVVITTFAAVLARCSNVHGLLCAVLKAQEESGDGDLEGNGETNSSLERRERGIAEPNGEYASLQALSSDFLEHVCDTAHQRCGRLLAVSISVCDCERVCVCVRE